MEEKMTDTNNSHSPKSPMAIEKKRAYQTNPQPRNPAGVATTGAWNMSTPEEPPESKRRKPNEVSHENEEWETHHDVIVELYMEYSLEEVAKRMEKQYKFKASTSQYRCRLKEWGVSKYTKYTPKQLLYIAREVASRSENEKGPAFRLNGKRLKSKDVERALNRNLEPTNLKDGRQGVRVKGKKKSKDLNDAEVSSLADRMSSCNLSGYTSSSKGVKVSWLSRLGVRSAKAGMAAGLILEEENVIEPIPPAELGKCLVKITDAIKGTGRDEWESLMTSSSSRLAQVRRELFDPWYMSAQPFENCHALLDRSLEIVRGHGAKVDFQVRGLAIPEETKLLLCFLHLTRDFTHGEDFTSFRVHKGYHVLHHTDSFNRLVKDRKVVPNRYCIECACANCGFLFETYDHSESDNDDWGIAHREKYHMWPAEFLNKISRYMQAHARYAEPIKAPLPESLPGSPQSPGIQHIPSLTTPLELYFGEWQQEDIARKQKENRIVRDSQIMDAASDDYPDTVSLSDIRAQHTKEEEPTFEEWQEARNRAADELENRVLSREMDLESVDSGTGPEDDDDLSIGDILESELWEEDITHGTELAPPPASRGGVEDA